MKEDLRRALLRATAILSLASLRDNPLVASLAAKLRRTSDDAAGSGTATRGAGGKVGGGGGGGGGGGEQLGRRGGGPTITAKQMELLAGDEGGTLWTLVTLPAKVARDRIEVGG